MLSSLRGDIAGFAPRLQPRCSNTNPGTVLRSWEDLQIKGYVPAPGENMKIYRNLIAPGYFDVMKIPILQGRDFSWQDGPSGTAKRNVGGAIGDSGYVMIVSREFVRRFLPNRNPIGQQVQGWGRWFTIVGVV